MYHNFIISHITLNGKISAEACGITVEGKNK
jgi:hypothetical protein